MNDLPTLVTVDIGNSRIKLGRFDRSTLSHNGLLEPIKTIALERLGEDFDFALLGEWLAEHVSFGVPLVVGSVSRPSARQLSHFLEQHADGQWSELHSLAPSDLPIANLTDKPECVGVDRLAAALAVNGVRRENSSAIVIDFGTAITVDLVNSGGEFEGGAILPGVTMSATVLHQQTDALPNVAPNFDSKSPDSVGKSTESAIEAGLYWGAVGAVRELIDRHADRLRASPQVFVTGGTSPDMARLLGSPDRAVRYLPHLVLSGLAIAGWELAT